MKKIIVTGSSGLIGSEVSLHFLNKNYKIHGIDNNQRAIFFGKLGDTNHNKKRLLEYNNYQHHEFDIRDRKNILELFKNIKID